MVWVPALESECGTVASPPSPTLSSSQNMHIHTSTHTNKMANFFLAHDGEKILFLILSGSYILFPSMKRRCHFDFEFRGHYFCLTILIDFTFLRLPYND
jgi:hypothetical protein